MAFRSKLSSFSLEWVFELKPLGKLLLLSPRRDELAWAKTTFLPHYSTPVQPKPKIYPKQHTKHIHSKVGTTQSLEMHNRTKSMQNKLKIRNPSFHYMEKASRISRHPSKWVRQTTEQIHELKNSGTDLKWITMVNPS